MTKTETPQSQATEAAGARPKVLRSFLTLGPGFVYALTVLGTGDLVSNSAAGAGYGYALIWALGLTLVFRFVWVNTSAKYVLVTGESLLTGYARLGNWVVWIVLIAIIVLRHFYNLYQILMMGSAADLLFHLPTEWSMAIWAFFFTFAGFALMYWGGYPAIELFCKVLIGLMGGALVVAALLSHPDPAGIVRGMFVPTIPGTQGLYSALFVLMALIGTEAGSMTNLTYAYFIREKGWRGVSHLKQQRFDLAFGIVCVFLMGTLLQIAAAGTIHPLGIELEGAEDLVRIFSEALGVVGLVIFGLGLLGAAFSTFVGATAGYGLIITDICRSFIPRFKRPSNSGDEAKDVKRDPIYRWSLIIWSFSPLYIVFTDVRPIWLVLMVSSVVVVLIPVLALTLLKITNDKSLMGKYKNGWFTNTVMILLVLLAVYFTFLNGIDLWNQLAGIF